MLEKYKMLHGGLSRLAVLNVFNNSQSEQGSSNKKSSSEDMSSQLNFTEFKEALAACAQLWDPNPYLAFERTVEKFLKQMLPRHFKADDSARLSMRRGSAAEAINVALGIETGPHADAMHLIPE